VLWSTRAFAAWRTSSAISRSPSSTMTRAAVRRLRGRGSSARAVSMRLHRVVRGGAAG
jgi:hypothetical protein